MPNTNLTDFEELRTRFHELWPQDVIYTYDNDPNIAEPTSTWARLSLQPGAQLHRSAFSRSYLQLGRVFLQIFVPAQLGTTPGLELAQVFIDTFRDWHNEFASLRCGVPEFRVSDVEKEYFTVICSVPYESDH